MIALLAALLLTAPAPTTLTTTWGDTVEIRTAPALEARIAPGSPWQPCYALESVGEGWYLACLGVGTFEMED